MINYLLFWEVKDNSSFEEQELSQRAKELWKLYSIPGDDPADFRLADPINGDIFCLKEQSDEQAKRQAEERKQALKQISLEIGCETEWRLLIFLMKDVNLLDKENHFGLVNFLAHLMNYDSPARTSRWKLEDCFLTCPQPESIWLITLSNELAHLSPGIPSSVRPDEGCYGDYPPNCRFLRFELDYCLQNSFSTKMLELHCGVRSLARDLLPAETLKGNYVYQMEVELDTAVFHDTVVEYDQWLAHVERAILQEETSPASNWLRPESAPTASNMPAYQGKLKKGWTPDHKKPQTVLDLLENEVDRTLEQDSEEERVRLQNAAEQLKRWAEQQSCGVMAASSEKEWRREMTDTEQEILPSHVRQDRRWKRLGQFCLQAGDVLFNLNGTLGELHPFASQPTENIRVAWEALKLRYLDSARVLKEMKNDCLWKVVRASITTLSGCLLVFYVLDLLEEPTDLWRMVLVLIASLLFTCAVYGIYMGYYYFRRGRAYGDIIKRQEDRIVDSREYFNKMVLYFRYSQILAVNERIKQEMEKNRSRLLRQKRELKYFQTICNQLKLCCAGQQRSGQTTAARAGSISGMLRNDLHLQLFRMSGSLPELALNGSHITAAFPFIKAIQLVRLVQ